MKFKVEIEIDWVGEDGELNDEFESKVREQIVGNIQGNIESKIVERMDSQLESLRGSIGARLDELVSETYGAFLDKEVVTRDTWGDETSRTDVKGMLKDKLSKFMTEKVDSYGKADNYGNTPRYEHILNQQSAKQIKDFTSRISSDVIKGIKNDINNEARDRITKAILSDYDLKKLIK